MALAVLEERLAGTTLEELEQAEQAVKQATARRDSAGIDLERHSLRSPVDGILDSRVLETGERPSPGQPVVVVLGGKQVHARVYVPEEIRVHIGPGTRALIHVDGMLNGHRRQGSLGSQRARVFALLRADRARPGPPRLFSESRLQRTT